MPKPERAETMVWCRPTSRQLLRIITAHRGEKLCETLDVLVRQEAARLGVTLPEAKGGHADVP